MRRVKSGGRTRANASILGLLGSGIQHSLSPFIHNFSAEMLSINCVYVLLESESGKFPPKDFFNTMWDMGVLGFNVTVPFKEEVSVCLNLSSSSSINTIYKGQKDWEATSTDADGLVLGMSHNGINISEFSHVTILGNGGAARALYDYFLNNTSLFITIMRRNDSRDADWLKLHERVAFIDWNLELLNSSCRENPRGLIIQTTSAPLLGQSLVELAPALDGFQGVFIDLIYDRPSALYHHCLARGLPTFDGIPMLIGQALLAQKFWWGRSADYNEIEKALRKYMRG